MKSSKYSDDEEDYMEDTRPKVKQDFWDPLPGKQLSKLPSGLQQNNNFNNKPKSKK